ncbi:hypothetical protein [Cupriavidus necator]
MENELNSDGTLLTLNLRGRYSALELEYLIAELAEVRAHMNPEVPMAVPEPGQLGSILDKLTYEEYPEVSFAASRDGHVMLWLRNAGLGWLLFKLSHANAAKARAFLSNLEL